MEITEYHQSRSVLDTNFIRVIFERDERSKLEAVQQRHPNSIIFMPNSDLVAMGVISGIGGSVPSDWNGEVIRL